MGKRKLNEEKFLPTKCPHTGCEKILKNKNNYDLHVKSCQKKPKTGLRRMESFFAIASDCNVANERDSDRISSTSGVVSDVLGPTLIDVNDSDTVIEDSLNSAVASHENQPTPMPMKCEGVDINIDGFYRRYPFHRHDSAEESYRLQHKIQIEYNVNGSEKLVAHSNTCDFMLMDKFDETQGKKVNKVCMSVVEGPLYRKMLEVSNSDVVHPNMRLGMMNHEQLEKKVRVSAKQLNERKLENFNLARKNNRLSKKLTLHKRIIEIIGTNDIPRLSMLIKVCVNSGMGVQSIIGRLADAIRGKYRANYSETEKDVAALAYKIGGPRLVHIMHVSHGLPGLTTTFNHCKRKNYFSAAVDESFDARIKHNMLDIKQNITEINTVKMDEIATDSRVRWNIADNKILGLCYQHSYKHSMTFDSMDDIQRLAGLIDAGTCHTTRETLVVFIGEVGNGGHVDPILTLPSCCKTESDEFEKMMSSIFNNAESDIVATDGDAIRRKTFWKMSKPISDQQVETKMSQCPLFDVNIVNGGKGVYFDDKHCAKRFRAALVSESRGCKVNGVVIARDQLLFTFQKAGLTGYKDALNPSDRQNVEAVLKLHQLITQAIEINDANRDIPSELLFSLKCVSIIFDCILCAFAQSAISLREQLTKFSTLSHALLYLYRKGGTSFILGQLFHDLQRMIQGAYYATACLQHRGGGKLFIYQLGTDQAETSFASVRTVTHSRNCDALELCHRLHHAQVIDDIIAKHPTWKRCHGRRLSSFKDYSSEREWTGDLAVNDVVLIDVWLAGRARAVQHLSITDEFYNNLPSGGNMFKPNKRLVGVTVDQERIELDLYSEDESTEQDNFGDDEMNNIETLSL